MGVITFTSDMGIKDYYVAAVKGAIISQCPDTTIVDITHDIPRFDISQAAFNVKNCYAEFPEGTIHIVSVSPEADVETAHVIVKYNNHFFIGADNGIFSLIFDREPDAIYELNIMQESDQLTFPTRTVFVNAASHLARGGTPEIIGKKIDSLEKKEPFRAVVEENVIKGSVIYIDSYGNVITNITENLFVQVMRGRKFTIFFRKRDYDIKSIHDSYNEVPSGEKVALFGSSGFLQIAINQGVEGSGGGANKLFGLKINDIVRIEFN